MSKLGDELIQSLKEALAHAQGDGPGVVHARRVPGTHQPRPLAHSLRLWRGRGPGRDRSEKGAFAPRGPDGPPDPRRAPRRTASTRRDNAIVS